MPYQTDEFIQELKKRRIQANMSQRELSARSGLSQAHISQIESGRLGLGLDSFINLARALDFEVALVPKRLLPAVEGIMRGSRSRELSPAEGQMALQTIRRGEALLKKLKALYGSSAELDRIAEALRFLRNMPLKSADVDEIANAINLLRRYQASPQARDTVKKISASLQKLRNRYAHAAQETPRAAYALDNDENHDG